MTLAVLMGTLFFAAALVLTGAADSRRRVRVLAGGTQVPSDASEQPSLFTRWRRRYRAGEAMQWVTAVRRLAALLQAGRSPSLVFGELATTSSAADPTGRWIARLCRDVHAAARVGVPVSTGLARFSHGTVAVGDRQLAGTARSVCAQLAACWEISERSGAPLGQTLAGVARSLESQLDAQAARDSALAGPRVTVRTLSWLPVLALGLGMLMGTDPVSTLLTTTWGRLALAAGAALSIAGRLWTGALLHRAESVTGP